MFGEPFHPTLLQKVGFLACGLALAFCGNEAAVGWGAFQAGWPLWVYYTIMTAVFGITGVLLAPSYFVPAILGGIVAGAGSLYATVYYLESVRSTYNILVILVAAVGCIPGVAIYQALKAIQDLIFPSPSRRRPVRGSVGEYDLTTWDASTGRPAEPDAYRASTRSPRRSDIARETPPPSDQIQS